MYKGRKTLAEKAIEREEREKQKLFNELKQIKNLLELMHEEDFNMGEGKKEAIIKDLERKKAIIDNALEEHTFSPKKTDYLQGKRDGLKLAIRKIENIEKGG